MKLKIKTLIMILLSILATMKSSAETYIDKKYGLKFNIDQLVLSKSESTSDIKRFVIGEKPFHKAVQYKMSHEDLALDEFINNKRKNDHKKSNKNQITYSSINLEDFYAYEIKIENRMSDNYWLVFQKRGDTRIFSFFLMADQKFSTTNETAISSYQSMKNSLTVFKGSTPKDIRFE